MSGLHPAGRTFDRRAILAGAAVTLFPAALAVALLGLTDAVVPILTAGLLGGVVAGWISLDTDASVVEWRAGGLQGVNAAGLGGLILVVTLLALDVPASTGATDLAVLFVASPFALLVFALVGFVGGYAGLGFRHWRGL
jgi:hypothetical protein